MALFKKETKAKTDAEVEKTMPAKGGRAAGAKATAATEVLSEHSDRKGLKLSSVLVRPHITEKATDLSGQNVYAFEIHQFANKMQVKEAVEKIYKVHPMKVAVINQKPKLTRSQRTGRTEVKEPASKKALVYLKQGDKIEFV